MDLVRLQQAARVALAAVLAGLGVWTLRGFLPALAWAVVLAIAIWPLTQWARRRWPPGRHAVLVPLLFTGAIALLCVAPLGLVAVQAGREAVGIERWLLQAQSDGIPVPDWVAALP